MAALTSPHWECVPPALKEAFLAIGEQPFARRFYLAGGTALANFEIADQQVPVETLSPLLWEEVKAFFVGEIRRIGHRWFEE